MMKKNAITKRILALATSFIVVASTVLSNGFTSLAADSDFKQVVKPDELADKQISATFDPADYGYRHTSALGTPGYFHIFTSGTFTQLSHVHGNFSAKYYNSGGRDSGIRVQYNMDNVDYAQNVMSEINLTEDRDYFLLGSDYILEAGQNSGEYIITDGVTKYEEINGKYYYIAIDKDSVNAPFINFSKEKEALVTKSVNAAAAAEAKYFVVDDENNGGILLDTSDNDGLYVVNVKYSQIKNWNKFHLRMTDLTGVEALTPEMKKLFTSTDTYVRYNYGDNTKTVVVNINMEGNDDREIKAQSYGWYQGPSASGDLNEEIICGEQSIERTYCNVLWNIHNNGAAYTGTLTFSNKWLGAVLAPEAGLYMKQNADGMFMCKDFIQEAETHAFRMHRVLLNLRILTTVPII